MVSVPHPDTGNLIIQCAVITLSDTRSLETDKSGQLIQQLLKQAGHEVVAYTILKEEPVLIQEQLNLLSQRTDVEVLIFNGGTGISPRDTTYDVIAGSLEKTLPGFGEIFRWLSYQEIGSRAIASRAIAGVFQAKLIFSIPGSTGAVKLALEKLILPEMVHLVTQFKKYSTN